MEPTYTLHVVPWLKRPAQLLVLPNWLAITLFSHIFTWRPLTPAELAHELAHVAQWKRYGLRFVWLYLRASKRAELAGGDRYYDNVFEIDARAAAEAARRLANESAAQARASEL